MASLPDICRNCAFANNMRLIHILKSWVSGAMWLLLVHVPIAGRYVCGVAPIARAGAGSNEFQ